MRIDVAEFHFWEMRTAYASYSKSAPSVQWTPLLAVTVEYVWVTVQTKVNRCISPRKRQREVERKTESEREREGGGGGGGREKTERWRWQRDIGSVTVSCRLVSSFLPSALGRSLAHNMESINPHRIPLSPPDTCPVCLPRSLSICLFVYMLLIDVHSGSWKSS